MANYILVPLNPSDQVEDIISRIVGVAQAGMTVIFLIPYQDRRISAEFSTEGMLTDTKALMKYSYEKQTRLADERVLLRVRSCMSGVSKSSRMFIWIV
jgi:hypothetical protein